MAALRRASIAGLSCWTSSGMSDALEQACAMVEEACDAGADIACLPELFPWTALDPKHKMEAAEPLGGTVSSVMTELAAKYSVNIVAPLLERDGDKVYNSMVWFDRRGAAIGKYRKVYPTDYEMAEGISPGTRDFDVFQTEFGPIGCCICFDLNFRDVIERIAAQNAKLAIFPSMFQGLALMRAWAKLYGMYFVSIAAEPYSAVVDPLGETVIGPWAHGPIMIADINLDYVVLHMDYTKASFPAITKTYGPTVRIDRIDNESEALVTSFHQEKSAEDIRMEFGLESRTEYLERSARLRDSSVYSTPPSS